MQSFVGFHVVKCLYLLILNIGLRLHEMKEAYLGNKVFIKDGGFPLKRKRSLILSSITKPSEGNFSSCPYSKDMHMQLPETDMA